MSSNVRSIDTRLVNRVPTVDFGYCFSPLTLTDTAPLTAEAIRHNGLRFPGVVRLTLGAGIRDCDSPVDFHRVAMLTSMGVRWPSVGRWQRSAIDRVAGGLPTGEL